MEAFDGVIDLLRSDGSIIINKNLAFRIGLETATVYIELLSKYSWFKDEDRLTSDGYFYNTIDNFRLDTTITGKRQRKAIEELEELNLIKTDLRGLPPKRHFKPVKNMDNLFNLIKEGKKQREELKEKLAEKADISKKRYFGGIKDSNLAETNTPNRSVNNTKRTILSNNTNNNGHQQSTTAHPAMYAKKFADDECYNSIKYYNHKYYMETDNYLNLKAYQWEKAVNRIQSVMNEQGLTVDDMKQVIDKYFADVESDHNILHFIDGDIIKHRLVELGLAHYSEVD